MTKGQDRTVTMVCDRDTKNTYRFQEEPTKGQADAIGQLYVQKHVFNGTDVEVGSTKITVTIGVE